MSLDKKISYNTIENRLFGMADLTRGVIRLEYRLFKKKYVRDHPSKAYKVNNKFLTYMLKKYVLKT